MKKAFFLSLMAFNSYSADLSEKYISAVKSIQDHTADLSIFKKYKVLVVPGVLAETFDKSSNQPIKLNILFDQGFKDQIEVLKENNIDFEYVKFDTENSPMVNGKIIYQAILKADRPVLIYSHSKGGLDTLEGLRRHQEVISKIKGWATVQSPFYGSPVADYFNNSKILKASTDNMFKVFGGSAGGFSALTSEERNYVMDDYSTIELLRYINSNTTFLNYGSIKQDIRGYDSSIEFFRDLSDYYAGENDGVVPIKSALLKEHDIDVNYIIEKDVDHLMTMSRFKLTNTKAPSKLTDYDRKAHALAILKLIAE